MAVWHEFATPDEAGNALAAAVAPLLAAAVERAGRAFIAVPGGNTPGPFLAALSRHDLPWSAITILPTDERFVSPDDPQSNERMIRANMPALASGAAGWLSFHCDDGTLDAAAATLDARLAALPPLDVLVCGMGADAHVASLFPGDPVLKAGNVSHVVAARPAGLPPRLSLAPARLAEARDAFLLVGGEAKRQALSAAVGRDRIDAPVALLLSRIRSVEIYWSAVA